MLTASTLAGELTLPYLQLVLAFGNRARLDLIPGLAENALPLKTIGDAMHIRNMVLRRVAQIELETDPAVRRRLGHFVVIGGGFSGVETAGELVDCLKGIRRYYPRVAKDELKVTLLQDQPRLLLELSERLGVAAHRSLAARGVDVRTSTRATCVGPRAVALAGGEMLHAATTICTIGTRPNALVERMTIPVERGRIVVNPDLSVRDTAGAVGDRRLRAGDECSQRQVRSTDGAVRGARGPSPGRESPGCPAGRADPGIRLPGARLDGRDRPQERCRRHLRHSPVGPAGVAAVARVLPVTDADARPEGADLRRMDMGHVLPDRHHSSALHPSHEVDEAVERERRQGPHRRRGPRNSGSPEGIPAPSPFNIDPPGDSIMMIARIEELLQNNEAFVAEQLRQDANYFDKLADGQHPEFLWIGCSDSRVPPDRITGHHARTHVRASEYRQPGRTDRHELAVGAAIRGRGPQGGSRNRVRPLRLRRREGRDGRSAPRPDR
jgi:hypothetical protein